jgi:hypothetical protein
MRSGLSKHSRPSAHDGGQVLLFEGKIGQGFRAFTTFMLIHTKRLSWYRRYYPRDAQQGDVLSIVIGTKDSPM